MQCCSAGAHLGRNELGGSLSGVFLGIAANEFKQVLGSCDANGWQCVRSDRLEPFDRVGKTLVRTWTSSDNMRWQRHLSRVTVLRAEGQWHTAAVITGATRM
jgi:hypothetical protein